MQETSGQAARPEGRPEGVVETDDGFAALGEILGPAFEKRFVLSIRQAVNDCYDRPRLAKGREVELRLSVAPVCDDHGNCLDVTITAGGSGAAKLPQVKLPPITCQVLPGGNALFRRHSRDNPRQRALEENQS